MDSFYSGKSGVSFKLSGYFSSINEMVQRLNAELNIPMYFIMNFV